MNTRRVVITGMGLITPLGNDLNTSWDAIKNGKSGIETLDHFDVSAFSTQFGGAIKNFDCSKYMEIKEARRMDEFMQYGIAAGVQAIDDSGIDISTIDNERAGVAIGSGIGGIKTIEETSIQVKDSGPRKVSPFFVPGSIINMIAGLLKPSTGIIKINNKTFFDSSRQINLPPETSSLALLISMASQSFSA